jgi:hypothetical protein
MFYTQFCRKLVNIFQIKESLGAILVVWSCAPKSSCTGLGHGAKKTTEASPLLPSSLFTTNKD